MATVRFNEGEEFAAGGGAEGQGLQLIDGNASYKDSVTTAEPGQPRMMLFNQVSYL